MNKSKKNAVTSTSKPKYLAPALEKGLDIIEYLSALDTGESLTSIAQGIGKSRGEIFRMLAVLEQRGFVERVAETDKFHLTDRLFYLGLNRPKRKVLLKFAIPAMEKFAEACGFSCHLSVKAGNEMVVVSRVESPRNVYLAVRVGHRLPLVQSPSGRCITAFSRPDEIDMIITGFRKKTTAKQARQLRDDLKSIKNNGYCIMQDSFSQGVTGLSAPILDLEENRCIAAMTSPVVRYMHLENLDLDEIADHLRQHAMQVSRQYSDSDYSRTDVGLQSSGQFN